MTHSPVDLFSSSIRLHGDGQVHSGPRSFDPTQTGWHMAAFHAETDADVHADHWEVHLDAEEVVSCLSGAIRIYLRSDDEGDDEEVKLGPGTALVVPRGRWHRIELDVPSDLMAVTVRQNTWLEARTKA